MLPVLLAHGTLMTWLLLVVSAIVIVVFIERLLHYHRAQINSMEFLNGVRNVLKRDNVVEALSICDASPWQSPPMPVTTISSAASTASCSTWRKPRRKSSTSSAARPIRTAHEISAQCTNFSRSTGRLPVCRGAVSGRHFSAVELIVGLSARCGHQAA